MKRPTRGEPRDLLRAPPGITLKPVLRIAGWLCALTLALGLPSGCSPKGGDSAGAPDTEKKADSESRVKRGPNDEVTITLDAATQKVMGLQTAPLEKAELSPEIQGYGHVLDASPLGSLAADLLAAQAAAAASDAELKRLQALTAQDNASQRALQTAQAAAIRDNTQVGALRLRLLANWGGAIAEHQDLPGFVQNLASLDSALVQLNLAAGEALSGAPTGARLLTLAAAPTPIPAQLLGPAPLTDPQMQNRGFFLLVKPNTARLAPGDAVSGFLLLPGEPQTGVAVPRAAIVQFNGAKWVYLQTADDKFRRVEIQPAAPLENGAFVQHGLNAGDKVVTVGAQDLLSEELKGQGGE